MIGHLGSRVSALLDGQLSEQEAERAWEHVHACHQCRDLVEREGWIKTQLVGLSLQSAPAPDHLPEHLKGSLLGGRAAGDLPGYPFPGLDDHRSRRLGMGLAAIGGGAVGAAVMGVLALGTAPADAPTIDRRTPVTSVVTPSPSAPAANVRRPGP